MYRAAAFWLQPLDRFMNNWLKLSIPADAKRLCIVRSVLKDFLSCQDVPEKTICKLVLCVDEACSNIIKYSYAGESECPIEIAFRYEKDDTFFVTVRDYGKQCDVSKIKPRNIDEVKPGGLGTHFMFEIMDSVEFCTKREKGTLLTMSKKIGKDQNSVSQNEDKGVNNDC